jgi:hypothetical protein
MSNLSFLVQKVVFSTIQHNPKSRHGKSYFYYSFTVIIAGFPVRYSLVKILAKENPFFIIGIWAWVCNVDLTGSVVQ